MSFSTLCVPQLRESWRKFFLPCPDVGDVLVLGDRVEADNAAVVSLVELEVCRLCALHTHNADHVVERLQVFVSLVLFVTAFVQRVDGWHEPSFFDGCFILGERYGRVLSHSLVRGPAAKRNSTDLGS